VFATRLALAFCQTDCDAAPRAMNAPPSEVLALHVTLLAKKRLPRLAAACTPLLLPSSVALRSAKLILPPFSSIFDACFSAAGSAQQQA
jgi:hypothetical protein